MADLHDNSGPVTYSNATVNVHTGQDFGGMKTLVRISDGAILWQGTLDATKAKAFADEYNSTGSISG